jgi:hypothetical protein
VPHAPAQHVEDAAPFGTEAMFSVMVQMLSNMGVVMLLNEAISELNSQHCHMFFLHKSVQ